MNRTASAKPRTTINASMIVILFLGGIVIVSLVAMVLFAAIPSNQRQEILAEIQQGVPEKHLIPEGYTGWLIAEHNVVDESALTTEEGINIFHYSDSGMLRTSSRWRPGIKRTTYLFDTESGQIQIAKTGPQRRIWGNQTITFREVKDGPIVSRRSCFFVGTQNEFKEAGKYYEQPGFLSPSLDKE